MHAEILEKEGYNIAGQFKNGATKPYLVGYGKDIAVAKIAGPDDPSSSIMQVRQDARILTVCEGLSFVPELYCFKELATDHGTYAYLVREHLKGKDIFDITYISTGCLKKLEGHIRILHDRNIAGLDMVIIDIETGISFAHNILVQNNMPFLYDFGRAKHREDVKTEEFEKEKEEDWFSFSYISKFRRS